MKERDIILAAIPQADGSVKKRPALLLKFMPPYGDCLVCGVSTQLRHAVPDFDAIVAEGDEDFIASGLKASSVIRLGFLAVLPRSRIAGDIGEIARDRHRRLLVTLSRYLSEGAIDERV